VRRAALLAAGLLLLGGCTTGQLPDPNDPKDGPVSAEVVNKQVRALNEGLFVRRARGEISEEQYLALLKRGAQEILDEAGIAAIDPSEAWQYAEVLRTAQLWPEAIEALKVAVQYAKTTKNEDRRVNDSLRLAQALAHTGKTEEAIATARTTFDVRPADAVPVMMGTLYEIVPAARGKGHDVELARLLEDAIAVHLRAEVDPNSEAGRAFLLARPKHVRKAWTTVIELYQAAGREDLAGQAAERATQSGDAASGTTRV
jgi:tetratricopeptide (TPR) repeat protein